MNLGLILSILVSSLGHVQAINSSNPECVDLERLQSTMTDAIQAIKVARVSVKCKPNSNCTGLECSGKINNKPFHGTVLLEGCHDPVRMLIHVNKKSLYVKDGYNRQVMSKPVPVHMQVYLEKKAGVVSVTLIAKPCFVSKLCLPIKILNNQEIRVRCNGSALNTTVAQSVGSTKNTSEFGPTMPPWSSDPTTQHKAFSAGHKSGNRSGGGGKSLSGGAIGGIVIAVVVFFIILIVVIVWIVHGKRQRIARYNDLAMNDDTDPLCFDSDPIA